MKKEKKYLFSVRLDKDYYRYLKIISNQEKTTMSNYISELIKQDIEKNKVKNLENKKKLIDALRYLDDQNIKFDAEYLIKMIKSQHEK